MPLTTEHTQCLKSQLKAHQANRLLIDNLLEEIRDYIETPAELEESVNKSWRRNFGNESLFSLFSKLVALQKDQHARELACIEHLSSHQEEQKTPALTNEDWELIKRVITEEIEDTERERAEEVRTHVEANNPLPARRRSRKRIKRKPSA